MGAKQTSPMPVSTSENDPGCVKTRASRECAELFSPLSSLRLCCQCCSFPIQRNRDKISMRKFDVGVFTQPRPEADQRGRAMSCGGVRIVPFRSAGFRAYHDFRGSTAELE